MWWPRRPLVLAEALLAAEHYTAAREAAAEALRISQAQENVIWAQHARELLGAPATSGVT